MKPLDITSDNQNGWDCVVPSYDIHAVQRSNESHSNSLDYTICASATVIAMAGASLSNEIILSIAIVILVAFAARNVYTRMSNKRTVSEVHDVVYRDQIERDMRSHNIFADALDAAHDLYLLVERNVFMERFADVGLIQSVLWQCARALSDGSEEGFQLAESHVEKLRSALDAAQNTEHLTDAKQLADTQSLAGSSTVGDIDYAERLVENLKALEQGAKDTPS